MHGSSLQLSGHFHGVLVSYKTTIPFLFYALDTNDLTLLFPASLKQEGLELSLLPLRNERAEHGGVREAA